MHRTSAFKYLLFLPIFIIALLIAAMPVKPAGAAETTGEFQVMCGIHHQKTDDPIVHPNKPGAAHMHSFYGNTTTNAASTAASLMAAPSNCGRDMQTSDRSAYWIPSLVTNTNGQKSVVTNDKSFIFIYYERSGGGSGPKVQPFPIGLRMIAGNAGATAAQPESVFFWSCGGGGGGPHYATIPTCNEAGQPLHASIFFPNCWNGKQLDSADHQSHMAYSAANGNCPASHPVSLPKLVFNVDYPGIKGGPNYELASGSSLTMHADFFAAWDSRVQNALVTECLNTPRSCIGIHRDGDTIYKPDYDPDPIPDIDLTKYSASQEPNLDQSPAVPAQNTQTPNPANPHTGHTTGTSGQVQGTATQTPQNHANHDADKEEVTKLPSTGATSVLIGSFILALLTYLFYIYRVKKQTLRQALLHLDRWQ